MDLPSPRPIAEYHDVDAVAFRDIIRPAKQPAVMRGLASSWPAVAAARKSDEDFVAYASRFIASRPVGTIVGAPEIQGRFLYNDDLNALNFKRGTSNLIDFFDWLLRDRGNPRPHAMAIQSEHIPGILPGFDQENRIDLLSEDVIPRAWIGNRIRVAPHYDLMENIGIVVAGRRSFILFPPEQIKNLYVGPLELTPAGTPVSLVDPMNPDLDRYPRFAEAIKTAQTAVLEPGDAIYIPFHWWHGVDSLESINLFVNYWWNDRRTDIGNPYAALIHALYAIKSLPPEQREVWRGEFEHYVFGANGDPAAHIPAHARGMLGELDAEQIGRIRATLRQVLE
jgi:hypothetical protein